MALRIGIDLCGTDAGKSGMSTVVRAYLCEFRRQFPQHHFCLIGLREDREAYVDGVYEDASNFSFHEIPEAYASPSRNVLWHVFKLGAFVRKLELDALLVLAGNRRGAAMKGVPVIVSIPDLWHKVIPGKFGWQRRLYLDWLLPRYWRRAARITAVSEHTRQELSNYYDILPNEVVVTPNGCDHEWFRPGDPDEAVAVIRKEIPQAKPPFIGFASRIEHPSKNHQDLIRAFEILKESHDIPHSLICPGKSWPGSEPVFEMVENSPYKDVIHFPGFVSKEFIPALFQANDIAIFPSRYEGFGLPVVEAMACGSPMVTSDIAVLAEVGGDATLTFTPGKPEQLAEQMWKLLSDPSLRASMREKALANAARFRWDTTVKLVMDTIESAVAE